MKNKKITDVVIDLTEKQLLLIEHGDEATPQALEVPNSEIKSWDKIPYFRGVWYAVENLIDFNEIDENKKGLQAAALAFEGFSYQDIETHLDLPQNTLIR